MSDCVNDFWNSVGKEQIAKGAGVSVRTQEIKEFQEGTRKFEDIDKTASRNKKNEAFFDEYMRTCFVE